MCRQEGRRRVGLVTTATAAAVTALKATRAAVHGKATRSEPELLQKIRPPSDGARMTCTQAINSGQWTRSRERAQRATRLHTLAA